jgi:serine/threonine protein kinase
MQYLPLSIYEHIKLKLEAGESLDAIVSDIGVQLLDGLKEMHTVYRLHRDIKTENMRSDGNKVYLTDFGTILRCNDENGQFNQVDRVTGYFAGSHIFLSLNGHYLRSISFRDDLESLGYTLLVLLAGPESFWYSSKSKDHRYYITEKKNFIDSQTIDPRLKVIQKLLREVI